MNTVVIIDSRIDSHLWK